MGAVLICLFCLHDHTESHGYIRLEKRVSDDGLGPLATTGGRQRPVMVFSDGTTGPVRCRVHE